MIVITVDPISGKDVTHLSGAPYLLEGEGDRTLKTYFESLENLSDYADVEFIDKEAAMVFFSDGSRDVIGGQPV